MRPNLKIFIMQVWWFLSCYFRHLIHVIFNLYFASKVNLPQKIRSLIWQLISEQVAVTKNLIRCNIQCDNYCPKCGEPNENVIHVIFECSQTLQVWELSSTPSNTQIFSILSSMYVRQYRLSFLKEEYN